VATGVDMGVPRNSAVLFLWESLPSPEWEEDLPAEQDDGHVGVQVFPCDFDCSIVVLVEESMLVEVHGECVAWLRLIQGTNSVASIQILLASDCHLFNSIQSNFLIELRPKEVLGLEDGSQEGALWSSHAATVNLSVL